MKKYGLIIVLVLLALVLVGLAAPFLLESRKIQTALLNRLGQGFQVTIKTEAMAWRWLPSPRLVLTGVELDHDLLAARVPRAVLSASVLSLFARETEIATLSLYSPRILLKSWPAAGTKPGPSRAVTDFSKLPRASLIVEDGSFSLAPGVAIPFFKSPATPELLTGFYTDLETGPDALGFTAKTRASFAREIKVKGSFLTANRAYALDIDFAQLELAKAMLPLADGQISPAESVVDLTAHVEGRGNAELAIKLKGGCPDLAVKFGKTPQLLKGGAMDLVLAVKGADMALDIKNLEVREPAFVLAGQIEQRLPTAGAPDSAPEPVWMLKLAATDLDATAIRQAVLTLWPDDPIAKTVCGIVLAGKARQAAYAFEGTLADFADLERMTLTVDVETATVLVPEADLHLTNAQGPIKIEKGLLSGQGLSADLATSSGKNCSLLVGLSEHRHDFRLALDLDADLAALPPILKRLVKEDRFQAELARFRGVTGRAIGTLKIGDTLHDPKVEVTARQIKATGRYDRLSFPIAIEDGEFSLLPTQVAWKGIKASLGPHRILTSDGRVVWADRTLLEVTRLDLLADGTALLAELTSSTLDQKGQAAWRINSSTTVPDAVAKIVTMAQGPVEIRNGHIRGVLGTTRDWQYGMTVALNNFKWSTPLLPGAITTEHAKAEISHERIDLLASRSWFLDQVLEANGRFRHRDFDNWQGAISLSGTVQERVAFWVREKKWIPEPYFPRIPCTLKGLTVTWDPQTIAVTGAVLAGSGGPRAASASLDLISTNDELVVRKIRFLTPDEQGTLSLRLRDQPSKAFLVNWQGNASANTINALLEKNELTNGTLRGDFTINNNYQKGRPLFEGQLIAENTSQLLGVDLQPFQIRRAALAGDRNRLIINELTLTNHNQTMTAKGSLTTRVNALDFKLDLAAERLSRTTMDSLLRKLETLAGQDPAEPARPEKAEKPLKLAGTLTFAIGAFTIDHDPALNEPSDLVDLVVSPLAGRVTVQAKDLITTEIRDSALCGIRVKGIFHSSDQLGPRSLSLTTDPAQPVLFQDVLSCLRVEQNLLEGPLTVDINLKGNSKQWLSGHANLHATKGYIRRFTLLSKIFSIVNLTDLFSATGLSDLGAKGLPYSTMDIETQIKNQQMLITKGVIRGDGLNLFGKGSLHLDTLDSDITLLIAPLKTFDSIVAKVPIVGRAIGGINATIVTIPVGIKGNIQDPRITVLSPKSVGEGLVNLVADVLKIPFYIIEPIIPKNPNSN